MKGIYYGSVALSLIALVWLFGYCVPNNKQSVMTASSSKDSTHLINNTMKLASTAFSNNEVIPSKYTCDGNRLLSPPLSISDVPSTAKSLVLIMDDPDVPKEVLPSGVFDHWVVYNIPPSVREIKEGDTTKGTVGTNGAGGQTYTGPCPPPQYEPSEHRYFFKLYALDIELSLNEKATKNVVLNAISNHVIAESALVGRYKRK